MYKEDDTIAVIGDIHGCPETLLEMLDRLPNTITDIYSVGDLIDRGLNSKRVVQICIDNNIQAVRGNHEDMFLDFMANGGKMGQGCDKTLESYDEGIFLMNGGNATTASYGGCSYNFNGVYDSSGNFIKPPKIPKEHLDYFEAMPYYIETEDLIISHAGIHPLYAKGDMGQGVWSDINNGKAMYSLMWNRSNIAKVGHKLQIFGHTPVTKVEHIEKYNPLNETGDLIGINIDTGCGKRMFTSKLSVILYPSLKEISIDVKD